MLAVPVNLTSPRHMLVIGLTIAPTSSWHSSYLKWTYIWVKQFKLNHFTETWTLLTRQIMVITISNFRITPTCGMFETQLPIFNIFHFYEKRNVRKATLGLRFKPRLVRQLVTPSASLKAHISLTFRGRFFDSNIPTHSTTIAHFPIDLCSDSPPNFLTTTEHKREARKTVPTEARRTPEFYRKIRLHAGYEKNQTPQITPKRKHKDQPKSNTYTNQNHRPTVSKAWTLLKRTAVDTEIITHKNIYTKYKYQISTQTPKSTSWQLEPSWAFS